MTDRPLAIRWFDRAYLASIALGIVVTIGTWDDLTAREPDDPEEIYYALVALLVLAYGLSILLWSLIVRHRSRVAKWILTILTLVSLPMLLIASPDDARPLVWRATEAGAALLGLAALGGLFTPAARRWFRWESDGLAETFS